LILSHFNFNFGFFVKQQALHVVCLLVIWSLTHLQLSFPTRIHVRKQVMSEEKNIASEIDKMLVDTSSRHYQKLDKSLAGESTNNPRGWEDVQPKGVGRRQLLVKTDPRARRAHRAQSVSLHTSHPLAVPSDSASMTVLVDSDAHKIAGDVDNYSRDAVRAVAKGRGEREHPLGGSVKPADRKIRIREQIKKRYRNRHGTAEDSKSSTVVVTLLSGDEWLKGSRKPVYAASVPDSTRKMVRHDDASISTNVLTDASHSKKSHQDSSTAARRRARATLARMDRTKGATQEQAYHNSDSNLIVPVSGKTEPVSTHSSRKNTMRKLTSINPRT
jgi:hypothetical protein